MSEELEELRQALAAVRGEIGAQQEHLQELNRREREIEDAIGQLLCPWRIGDRFDIDDRYYQGRWQVERITLWVGDEWKIEARNVKKDGSLGQRTGRFYDYDMGRAHKVGE